MFAKRPTILLGAVLGALCLGGAGPASAQSQAVQLADGWSYDGVVDRLDHVELVQTIGESAVLKIEKTSPYEADKFLQVYKHFAGQSLQGKRIRMTFEHQTQIKDGGAAKTAVEPAPAIVTRVQCFLPQLGMRSIYAAYRQARDIATYPVKVKGNVEFIVPTVAQQCTLGFALTRPLEMTISNIKFEEIKAPLPAVIDFALPTSPSDLPTLELSPPEPVK